MSGSVEIATWIHEYELRALEKYLAMEGTDTEQVMQKMLAELYSDRVPLEERQAIQKRIETERAEQLARQMANTTWTAYHVTGHGVERYFKTATADQLLHTAMRLRTYLSGSESSPGFFCGSLQKPAAYHQGRVRPDGGAKAGEHRTYIRCL